MRACLSIEERLAKHIKKGDSNECWEWLGGTAGKGYGTIKVLKNNKWVTSYTHRETLKLHDPEPAPPNNHALHSCDNPKCCNPKHLSWGSNSKNRREARDRLLNQGNQKLTPDQVSKIRLDPRPSTEIALDYAVHYDTILRIKQGRSWHAA